jgi:hypothetical protein
VYLPLLGLKVAVICALDLAGFHEDLGRRAIDALLEACLPSVSVASVAACCVLPVHDMAADGVVCDSFLLEVVSGLSVCYCCLGR